MLIMMN